MKKVLVLMLGLLLIAGLVACGGTNSPVEEFLSEYGDELQDELAAIMGNAGRVEVAAGRGNEMVFSFHFETIADAGELKAALDALEPVFETLAGEIQEELELDSIRLTVRFYDTDGGTIERNFETR